MTDENPTVSLELRLAALLHDASEAYIGDMVKPLKIHLPFYCEVENKIQKAIFSCFLIDIELLKEVKPFDLKAQQIEYNCFYKYATDYKLFYMSPKLAYEWYLDEIKILLSKMPSDSICQ